MASDDLPAHASPVIRPVDSHPQHPGAQTSSYDIDTHSLPAQPPLVTPAFTPPRSPDSESAGKHASKRTKSIPVDSTNLRAASLLQQLPHVECIVRARIPTTSGKEMFLHLYKNDFDNKEHLAIVFGPTIRSRSLDAEQPGETERDRMIRGAYVGRLFPGRTSSRLDELARMNGLNGTGSAKGSPLLRGLQRAKVDGNRDRDVEKGVKLPPAARPLHETEVHGQVGHTSARSVQGEAFSTLSPPPASQPQSQEHSPHNHAHHPSNQIPLVRIHSECYTGETVWSARCDCGEQLDEAARLMSEGTPLSNASTPAMVSTSSLSREHFHTDDTGDGDEEEFDPDPGGVIIYLRQEGRGIGLSEKLKAYNLQDLGSDTYEANLLLRHPADARSYGLATAMLVDLGLGGERGIRLLTNNPDKIRAVEGANREVIVRERVAMVPIAWRTGGKEGVRGKEVEGYLRAKASYFVPS